MRTTTGLEFYCRKSKTNKKGYTPLELSIIINGTRKFLNLPYKVKYEDWAKKKKPQELEDYMSSIRTRTNQIITEMVEHKEPLTVDALRDYLRTGGYRSYTVGKLCEDYLDILNTRKGKTITEKSVHKYEKVMEILKQDLGENSEVSAITPGYIQQLYARLQAKYLPQTSGGMMTRIKTVITYALNNNKLQVNPFQSIKISKGKSEVHFLTEEEIKMIENNHFDTYLEKARVLFVFQLNSGLAYTDLIALKPEDMQEENGTYYIRKPRNKTGEIYTAVVLPKGVEIWKQYNGILPFITNQPYNRFLKLIQSILGIQTNLTTHLARKSYCCRLLAHKVPLLTVSKCLGHSSTKVTQQYYAALTKSEILDEVSSAFKVG